jgi:hypothetical protein
MLNSRDNKKSGKKKSQIHNIKNEHYKAVKIKYVESLLYSNYNLTLKYNYFF